MILADTSAWIEYDRATGYSMSQQMTTQVFGGACSQALT